MSQTDINIKVSVETEQARNALRTLGTDAKQLGSDFEEGSARSTASLQSTVTSVTNVANSFMALYMLYDNVERSSLAVERAEYRVKQSTDALKKAQDEYNNAVAEFGRNSPEAERALDNLRDAEWKLANDTETAKQRQQDAWRSYVMAVTIGATQVITAIGNIKAAYAALSGLELGGALSSAAAAAAPAAMLAAPIAGTAMAVYGTAELTSSGYLQQIQSGYTPYQQQVYGQKVPNINYPASQQSQSWWDQLSNWASGLWNWLTTPQQFASGAYVDKPTLAWVGENGPEVVIPIDPNRQVGFTIQDIWGGITNAASQVWNAVTSWAQPAYIPTPQPDVNPFVYTSGFGISSPSYQQTVYPSSLGYREFYQPALNLPGYLQYTVGDQGIQEQFWEPYPTVSNPPIGRSYYGGGGGGGAEEKPKPVTIQEVNINISDVKIDPGTLARFRRELAYNTSKAICDAINERRNL